MMCAKGLVETLNIHQAILWEFRRQLNWVVGAWEEENRRRENPNNWCTTGQKRVRKVKEWGCVRGNILLEMWYTK